jgi:hypothetical protein
LVLGDAISRPLQLRPERRTHRREVVWAVTISIVLVAGIIGTLLLQTATQTQARSLQIEHRHAGRLATRSQLLRRNLSRDADPAILARRAAALHMRPQVVPRFVPAGRTQRLR